MTHLTWSDEIGKRIRTGDWADQATSTVTKIHEVLAEAGDDFGPNAGRREVAAQLVDSFMEEAKVIYLIYRVWTDGFLDWLRAQGVTEAEVTAELESLCPPDGVPGRHAARRPRPLGRPR